MICKDQRKGRACQDRTVPGEVTLLSVQACGHWYMTRTTEEDLVSAKVRELQVEVVVEHTVLWLNVTVVDATLVQVHDGQQDLCEVVTGQGLREGKGSSCSLIGPCDEEVEQVCSAAEFKGDVADVG